MTQCPAPSNGRQLEGLLIAAGARVIEGRGSRVRFEKDGEVETFHRPHPSADIPGSITGFRFSHPTAQLYAI